MFLTQKKFETNITVFNDGEPQYASGGTAIISSGVSQSIKAVIMPDDRFYRENRKEGQYISERVFAHVRKDEMDKVDMIPGKSRITWNGYSYEVVNILDYRDKPLFRNAEIEMRRRIGVDGNS